MLMMLKLQVLERYSLELKYRISGASASRFKELYCMCYCISTL